MRTSIVARLLVVPLLLAWPTSGRADPAPEPPPARVRAWQTGLLAPDRLQHASLAMTIGLGVGVAGARPTTAFLGTSALGLAKELHDRGRSRFDPVDLAADVLGAGISALLVREFRR